jgi:hypothetical protein
MRRTASAQSCRCRHMRPRRDQAAPRARRFLGRIVRRSARAPERREPNPRAIRPLGREKCQLEDRTGLKSRSYLVRSRSRIAAEAKAVRHEAAAGLEIAHRRRGSCCRSGRSARRRRSRGG